MKKYMLIECVERDFSVPEFYDTYEQAHDAMCNRVADVICVDVEEIKASYAENEDYREGVGVTDTMAWAERFGNNYDWKIFNLSEFEVEE